MHLNVEIKARCSDPERVRSVLYLRGAEHKGLDHQIDTYFKVNEGRLKLREGNIENVLVFYKRDDQEGPKNSEVILYPCKAGNSLKQALLGTCGELVVVDKRRDIYFIDNIKFHVDDVVGLGSYCEIEAIDLEGDIGEDRLLEQCKQYMEILGITEGDLVAQSYSDLLLAKQK